MFTNKNYNSSVASTALLAIVGLFFVSSFSGSIKDKLQIGDILQTNMPSLTLNGTDILGYSEFKFVKSDYEEISMNLSARSALQTAFSYFLPGWIAEQFKSDIQKAHDSMWSPSVDIHDARKHEQNLDFQKTGFSLFQVENLEKIDWSSSGDSAVNKFKELVTPHLLDYYPNATRFVFSIPVQRGTGLGLRLINIVHTDFLPDQGKAAEFVAAYPPDKEMIQIYAGHHDSDKEEMGAILGLWTPTGMNTPVCDRPLAVVDISTVKKEDFKPLEVHLNYFVKMVHILSGFLSFNPTSKWYYYSYQKPDEVLLFHQFLRSRSLSNPHASFINPHCGDEYETRVSTEFRVAVFWEKQQQQQQQQEMEEAGHVSSIETS